MRKFIVLLFLAVLAFPATSFAGIHGVLKGKVTDSDGKGVMGASVRVEGTTLGAYVRTPTGEFTIANIVAGTYKIRVSAVGKGDYIVETRVTADQTTNVNVTLRDKDVTTQVIEVIAKKEMVDNSSIGSKNVLTNDDLVNVAGNGSMASVIGLSAGVTNNGDGFGMRGSRSSESQIRFNGIDMGNQFSGGFGGAGSYYAPIVSTYATEEVQVLKGSFSAEHGDALGGIVNTVPRTGRSERYEGFIRYRTDVPALFGSQANGLQVYQDGNKYKAELSGPGAELQGKGENSVDFGVGGPLPFLGKSTFFISSTYLYEANRSASYKILDPDGNNLGLRPDNQLWRKNITPILSFALTDNIKLIVGGMYGTVNFESSSTSWLYSNDEGTPSLLNGAVDVNGIPTANGIPERVAKQTVFNQVFTNMYARVNHSLTSSSFYEFTVSTNTQNEASARRKGWEDPSYFTGYELYEPSDIYQLEYINTPEFSGTVFKPIEAGSLTGDKVIDIYQPLTEIRSTADGYYRGNLPAINPLTGYYEGQAYTDNTNNAFGASNAYYSHGNSGGFQFRENTYIQFDGNYTNIFKTGDFSHSAKGGFELRFYEQHRHQNSNPWNGQPWYDIYTDRWGGNLYADSPELYEITSKPFNPIKFSAYLQDQISYKGIVISGGLRFDFFDPQSKYRTNLTEYTSINDIDSTALFADSPLKFQVSPRINITYPITVTSNLSIGYGMYFQNPLLSSLFDNYNTSIATNGMIIGNPNMDAQKSRQYEVAYRNQLSEDFALTVTTYFKDIYNQMGLVYVATRPEPFYLLDITEYSNSRGIELELFKRPADNFMFSINYTLAYSEGTSSGPYENGGLQIDYYTDKPAFPLATYSLDNDIRHAANLNTTIFWTNNDGPSIGGIQILENVNLTLTGTFQSGSPYTRLDLNYKPISERNAERGPSYWNLDARVTKAFYLKDWFGEGFQRSKIEFFAEIRNVLNLRGASGFYTTTNSPINDGKTLDKEIGSFAGAAWYKEASYAEPGSLAYEQYDSYGNRLYNAASDYDNNGIVTQQEKYETYIKRAETTMKFLNLYRTPIRVFAGVNISF